MKRRTFSIATIFLLALTQAAAYAQTRDEKVRTDRDKLADDNRWIYNDLPAGFAEARQTDKPLLIVFR